MTWNLHGAARPNVGLVAHVIERATPDVVALQEVRRGQAARLAGRLGWQHEWVFKHNGYWPLWWRAEGLAILSPSPLDDVLRACLSVGASRRSHRRRVAIAATVRRDGDALHVVDTHLATGSRDERVAQATRLLAAIVDGVTPLVVAGDLNAPNEVEVIQAFAPVGLVDPGGDDTSPADAPMQRIDYVLVPADAEILDRRTPAGGPEWAALSDHLPTLVELTI
ncbi:MAG: endonuclease/exonuclease/phosphatase family protein [Ilumatobacteraceae bacterium]